MSPRLEAASLLAAVTKPVSRTGVASVPREALPYEQCSSAWPLDDCQLWGTPTLHLALRRQKRISRSEGCMTYEPLSRVFPLDRGGRGRGCVSWTQKRLLGSTPTSYKRFHFSPPS